MSTEQDKKGATCWQRPLQAFMHRAQIFPSLDFWRYSAHTSNIEKILTTAFSEVAIQQAVLYIVTKDIRFFK